MLATVRYRFLRSIQREGICTSCSEVSTGRSCHKQCYFEEMNAHGDQDELGVDLMLLTDLVFPKIRKAIDGVMKGN